MTALEEIKKALESVTPGPWFEGDKWVFVSPRSGLMNEALENVLRNDEAQANARYIAAVNPAAISELLSAIESLQRENEMLRASRDGYAKQRDEILRLYDEERISCIREAKLATDMAADCNDAQDRAEAAEAALKPFVAFFDEAMAGFTEGYSDRHPDKIICGVNGAELSISAFIAARTALASTGGEHHGN